MNIHPILSSMHHGLIVSCQAFKGEPTRSEEMIVAFALAAKMGGAVGIRSNSPEDIAAIHRMVDLPIFGLYKQEFEGFFPYITPTVQAAIDVAQAGASIIALDTTDFPHPGNISAGELIQQVKQATRLPVLGDISTVEEGIAAAAAGADAVSTTLSGYTPGSPHRTDVDFDLLEQVAKAVDIPVFAEGRIWSPEEAARAVQLGAYGVIVGGAITRPHLITERFVRAIKSAV